MKERTSLNSENLKNCRPTLSFLFLLTATILLIAVFGLNICNGFGHLLQGVTVHLVVSSSTSATLLLDVLQAGDLQAGVEGDVDVAEVAAVGNPRVSYDLLSVAHSFAVNGKGDWRLGGCGSLSCCSWDWVVAAVIGSIEVWPNAVVLSTLE